MYKTKRVLFLIISLVIFNIFSWVFLRGEYSELYTFLIQPLFYMVASIYSHFFIFSSREHIFEYKKYLMFIFFTGALFYIVIYFVLGILVSGFSNNPYDNTLNGIFYNLWSIGSIVVFQEILRSAILNSKTKINNKLLTTIVILLFIGISINYRSMFTSFSDLSGTLKFFIATFFPLVIINILFTFTSKKGGPIPAIVYFLVINFGIWIAPILPNHEWIISTLLYILVPFITYIVFDNNYQKRENKVSRVDLEKSDPKNFMIQLILLIVIVLFMIGVLPYYPINVLTNSMYPEIHAGDVVVINKTPIEDIKVGDIIQFRKEDYSVMHRVIRIRVMDGNILINTKGDNNNSEDKIITTRTNYMGKVVIKIPKIGLPNLWFKELTDDVDTTREENN